MATSDDGELLASVIIPTRNRSRLLREAVEALDAQTLDARRFEVIVVDNRSTDDTAEVVRELQARVRFRLAYHVMPENRGPVRSRNTGAAMARGRVLAFTDSDCRPTPGWLAHGLAAFADPAVGFASGRVLYKPEQVVKPSFFARASGEVHEEHPTYGCSNVFYRRDVYAALGGADERLAMFDLRSRPAECSDTDLAWRAKERGYRNRFVPEALVHHECDVLPPVEWLLEPLRMSVLGMLVKRHPQLRRELLFCRLFFAPSNVAFYVLLAGIALGAAVHPAWLLLALPFLAWAVSLIPGNFARRSLPALALALPKTAVQVGFIALRHLSFTVALLYGSARSRALVL